MLGLVLTMFAFTPEGPSPSRSDEVASEVDADQPSASVEVGLEPTADDVGVEPPGNGGAPAVSEPSHPTSSPEASVGAGPRAEPVTESPGTSEPDTASAPSSESPGMVRGKSPTLGVDPLNSGLPIPGARPDVAVPTLDVLSATLAYESKDTFAKATLAPLAFMPRYLPVLSELRVAAFSNVGKSTFGGSFSAGYSRAGQRLSKLRVDDFDASAKECREKAELASRSSITRELGALRPILVRNGQTPSRNSVLTERMADDLVSWERIKVGLDNSNTDLEEGNGIAARLLEIANEADDDRAECLGNAAVSARMAEAYKNAWGIYAAYTASGFALVDGPGLQDQVTCSATQDPMIDGCVAAGDETFSKVAPHRLASSGVTLSGAYFPMLRVGIWLSASYTRSRAKPTTASTSGELAFGAAVSGLALVGASKDDGYLPGIGLGASYEHTFCENRRAVVSSGGMSEATRFPCLVSVPLYAADVSMRHVAKPAMFIDFRGSTKLQVRVAFPVTITTLYDQILGTERAVRIIAFLPTISASVATWAVGR